MIRRAPVGFVSVAALAALLLASGCGSFSENKNAATVNDHELSVTTFQKVLGEISKSSVVQGEVDGATARSYLTEWVESAILTDALAEKGYVVDDTARAAAQNLLQQSGAASAASQSTSTDSWKALSPESQQFLVDINAPYQFIFANPDFVSEDALRSAYEAGASKSGVFCLRVILVADQATADEVTAALGSGTDFATVADQHPAGANAAPGGVYIDPSTGSECLPATSINAQYAQQIAQSPIGTPTAAVQLQNGFGFFLQRPYDEVAASVRQILGSGISNPAITSLTQGQPARVDSRYGTWDASTAKVVPAN